MRHLTAGTSPLLINDYSKNLTLAHLSRETKLRTESENKERKGRIAANKAFKSEVSPTTDKRSFVETLVAFGTGSPIPRKPPLGLANIPGYKNM